MNLFKRSNLTIKRRNNIVIAPIVIGALLIAYVSYRGNENIIDSSINRTSIILDSTEKVKLKTITQLVSSNLSKMLTADTSKTDSSAYAIFEHYLDDFRYENDRTGYFYVYRGTKCFFIAENKHYQGEHLEDHSEYEQVKRGGGFSIGFYEKPGLGKTRKLLYSQMIPNTEFWIGTGTYLDTFDKIKDDETDELEEEASKTQRWVVIGILLLLVFVITIIIGISKFMLKIFNKIINITNDIALGKLTPYDYKLNDEVKPIFTSLNNLINKMKEMVNFSTDIGKGEFNVHHEVSSEHDVLGKSLLSMRDSLKEAKIKEDERIRDEEIRTWTMNGNSNVADILRKNQSNITTLAKETLKEIIEYSGFNQGGVFIVDEDDPDTFNLTASYAYNREKFITKSIKLGVGLVGTCAIERKTTYLKDIPNDYISITSGLGGSNPSDLILCPMIADEKLVGVIEFASFNEIEKHKVEFIERCAENIAATILTAKTAINTTKLLEMSKSQSEELSAQEEEMRQNMEELQSTNEEWHRKEDEMSRRIKELEEELNKKED
ncbi:MAG: GAF domain-containing protein [Bacteroidales bacterium]|jgi:methyl-accepting chemotaxis protein|nr:GAF domain-containing protein [Bacteroidales bacterium]